MHPFVKIILFPRSAGVNFSNPLNGRRWLKLLREHPRYGMTFHPDLDLPAGRLGFSFRSNALGFRGPDGTEGDGVVIGTSFAMGLSVDTGDNWYDRLLDRSAWFNVGMPVSPLDHANAIADLYRGSGKVLLYLYHPNVWKTAQGFVAARRQNIGIFSAMRWRTSLAGTLRLYPKWISKELAKIAAGYSVYRRWDGRDFFFNAAYNLMPPDKGDPFVREQISVLDELLRRFEKVIVVRVPIKEDSVPDAIATPALKALQANYDHYWALFRDLAPGHARFHELDHAEFRGEHFHPFDTHWTKAGNALFARRLQSILEAEGATGFATGEIGE